MKQTTAKKSNCKTRRNCRNAGGVCEGRGHCNGQVLHIAKGCHKNCVCCIPDPPTTTPPPPPTTTTTVNPTIETVLHCDDDCGIIFAPVCGTNDQTYINSCWLQFAACQDPEDHIGIKHEGECQAPLCDDDCGTAVEPACGTNGKTYPNFCWLHYAACEDPEENIQVKHIGECQDVRSIIECITLTGDSGSFSYTEDGSNYNDNEERCWIIETSGPVIEIEFTHFDTEKDYDFVSIRDGASKSDSLLSSNSGDVLPEIILTTGNQAFIHFSSDFSTTASGFTLQWNTIDSDRASSSCITLLGSSLKHPPLSTNYDDNEDICWIIATDGSKFEIEFADFDVEDGYDFVYIRDGIDRSAPLLATYTGNQLPGNVQSKSNKALIQFKSDYSVTEEGFELSWKIIDQSGCYTFNDNSGSIIYPNDGSDYLNDQDICWIIETSAPETIIEVVFTQFDTEHNYDFVTIRDGKDKNSPILAKYSGDTIPATIRTTGNQAFISFVSDYSVTIQGFSLRWNTIGSGCSCGLANTKRIVGGSEVDSPRKYPWMVMMYTTKGGSEYICGGSIINDRHIITAAHCFYSFPRGKPCFYANPTAIYADIGEHNRQSTDDNDDNYKSHSVQLKFHFIHPAYNCETYENDIAILRLSDPIEFNDVIRPICLPEDDSNTYESQLAKVAGWGTLKFLGDLPHTLHEVDVPILDTTCGGYLNIKPMMMCAGYPLEGGKDSCQGDSGGPLAVMENGKFVQVGVVSWGKGCAQKNNPGVYTRVSKFLSWINSISASGESCPN